MSIDQLRSQQPACPDFCNPETNLMPLQHTGLAALFLAAAASAAQAQPTTYPLTVTNCGQPITFEAAPDSTSTRSEEHTSELQSLMRISYAVFCLKKKNTTRRHQTLPHTNERK